MEHSPNTVDEPSLGPFSLKVFVINLTSTPKAAFNWIQGLIGSDCLWEFSMAAVGAEVTGSWFLSSGLVGLFIIVLLLLLSIFLTAICLDCNRSSPSSEQRDRTIRGSCIQTRRQFSEILLQLESPPTVSSNSDGAVSFFFNPEETFRHSFELQDSETEKHPSALIRVVKLEEVKENPMIGEIQKDEKEFHPKGDPAVSFSSSQSQQGELQTLPDPNPSEGTSVHVTPWRSHLMAPQSRDLNGSTPQALKHINLTAGDGRGNSGETLSPSANHLSTQMHYIRHSDDRNTVYARVSKKLRLTNSTVPTPEEAEPKLEEEEPEEERSHPLPDKRTWMEDREDEGGSMFISK
ncbi:hypothetical protein CRENBAI_011338 [Crenichthys baileyi]|uniref:Uncharacterized protein n=1 Tax=Crenichthys baileyi TaxID=28760 RepID=A0AAV9S1B5_9TELE